MANQRPFAPTANVPTLPLALTPHRSVLLTFFAFGIGMGLWSGASAALISHTGIGPATFGIALTGFTAVYLLGMSGASTLARYLGVKRVAIIAAATTSPTLALVLTSRSEAALIAGLLAYGLTAGVLDAAMNAQGVGLEKELRRPIMARLHGSASSGTAVGALMGSLIFSSGTPWAAVLVESVAFIAAAVAIGLTSPNDIAPNLRAGVTLDAKVLSRSLIVIGCVVGVSIACETAALSWSAPLLRGEAPWLAAIAGLGGAFFAGCQAILRLNADAIRKRVSDRTLIAVSLAIAATGLGIAALPFGFAVSAFGFAVVGFGTGAIVPCGFALAAARPGVSSAAAISAVAFFGLFARVPSPLVTGAIAEAFSLPVAFLAIAALLIVALVAVLLFVPGPPAIKGEVQS